MRRILSHAVTFPLIWLALIKASTVFREASRAPLYKVVVTSFFTAIEAVKLRWNVK